jgi:hypothetical protein
MLLPRNSGAKGKPLMQSRALNGEESNIGNSDFGSLGFLSSRVGPQGTIV